MGRKPIAPQVVKEVLRLRHSGLSFRQIADQCGISRAAAQNYFNTAQNKGIDWETAKYHSNAKVIETLQTPANKVVSYLEPDFTELAKLRLLRKVHNKDEAYQYYLSKAENQKTCSRATFYRLLSQWLTEKKADSPDSYFTQSWVSGQCCQIDYSGDGLSLQVEQEDGRYETRKAEIFVGVLPYSKYLFCYATKDQTRESWLEAIVAMFKFFNGVPKTMLLDNSSSLVLEASRHHPVLCNEIMDLGRHYKLSVEAVAPYEPTYKGSVENAVKIIQNKILNHVRSVRFFSISEINSVLSRELLRLNSSRMRQNENLSRREIFELEHKALRPLPEVDFQYGSPMKRYKVNKNYCIRIRLHNYSVPYRYIGLHVLARVTKGRVLEIFDIDSRERIAQHYYYGETKPKEGFSHFDEAHRPPNHVSASTRLENVLARLYNETTPDVQDYASRLLRSLVHISDFKKGSLIYGLLSLKKKFGLERLSAACAKALALNRVEYSFILELLKEGGERLLGNEEMMEQTAALLREQGFLRDYSGGFSKKGDRR